MLTFEKMRSEEHSSCAKLASRAFGAYEYFTYHIPNEQRLTRFLRTILEIEVRNNDGSVDFLTVKEDRNIVAVAMLCILKMMSMLTVIKLRVVCAYIWVAGHSQNKKGDIQGVTP